MLGNSLLLSVKFSCVQIVQYYIIKNISLVFGKIIFNVISKLNIMVWPYLQIRILFRCMSSSWIYYAKATSLHKMQNTHYVPKSVYTPLIILRYLNKHISDKSIEWQDRYERKYFGSVSPYEFLRRANIMCWRIIVFNSVKRNIGQCLSTVTMV